MTAPARGIAALDVPLADVEAELRLKNLQSNPPAGHTPVPQPADWYEAAFDALIEAHQNTLGSTA